MLNKTRRRVLAGTATALLPLTLAACGDTVSPGVAAEVDGQPIQVSQVDDLARVICATQGGQQGGEKTPTASVRALALNVLLDIEVAKRVGDLRSADQKTVTQSLQSAAQARALVKASDRALFDQVVGDSTRAGLLLTQLATQEVQAAGGDPNDQNAVQAEVAKLQAKYIKEAKVEVAPRFGTLQDGRLIAGDGSLSVPVSKTARSFKGGSSDDPFGSGNTADYPANQRCS